MPRTLLTLVVGTVLALTACKKNDAEAPAPSDALIKGIVFTDLNGQPMGKMGTPEDTLMNDSLGIFIVPNPVKDQFAFVLNGHPPQALDFTCTIIHAIYPAAPDSFYIGRNYPVVVENQKMAGQEIFRQSGRLPADTGWRSTQLIINAANYPKGFYRLIVETSTGVRFKAGIYKG